MKESIEKELGQSVEVIKSDENIAWFNCEDGIQRNCKLLKNGKVKKNSIRVE